MTRLPLLFLFYKTNVAAKPKLALERSGRVRCRLERPLAGFVICICFFTINSYFL